MIRTLLLLGAGAWLLSRRADAAPPPNDTPGEPALHIVKLGESLSSIARDELGNLDRWPELATLNNLSPPYIIRPGQQILMPADY